MLTVKARCFLDCSNFQSQYKEVYLGSVFFFSSFSIMYCVALYSASFLVGAVKRFVFSFSVFHVVKYQAAVCYQVVTSYTPFVTEDAALLNECLTNGTVVNLDGQYFITPQVATVMRNANRSTVADTTIMQSEQFVEEETVIEEQSEIYVYITATGKKYHAINNCGNTNPNNTRYVTLSYAQQLGLGACSKCY